MPLLSNIRVCSSDLSGVGYSVLAPVFGSSLPISDPVLPVYQMLPSPSSLRPCGPECSVLRWNSLISPVFGSTRPSTLANWPVYQSEPSFAANGSCGRDPGVGACHSLNETSAGPSMTTPVGLPFSGKALIRYALSGSTWSAGSGAPWLCIICSTVVQPSGV